MTIKSSGASPRPQRQKAARGRLSPLKMLILAGTGLVLIGVVLLVVSTTSAGGIVPPRVGATMSNFTLTDLSGKTVRLSDYAGKPVLINAWATWCPPCRAEMPDLYQFYQDHKEDGFVVLAVNAGEDGSIVKSFIQENGFTFPVLLDPNTSLLDKLAIRGYPTSIVIGRDGKVKLVQVGMLTADALQKVVAPLITQ
jgi:peroxiredoxin